MDVCKRPPGARRLVAFALFGLAGTLTGCATLSPQVDREAVATLLEGRNDRWAEAEVATPMLKPAVLDLDAAIRLAFQHHPEVRAGWARLGLARAGAESARRLPNPRFGFSRLEPEAGSGAQITRSLSLGLSEALLLPARQRLAADARVKAQETVAHGLLGLARDVEIAWHDAVAARQVAALRQLVAQSGAASALLAQRLFDAGNISRLQLEQERAAAASAELAALRAETAADRARQRLATAIGWPEVAAWPLPEHLPQPLPLTTPVEQLLTQARSERLDLAAARRTINGRGAEQQLARRWRWLGDVEVEYEWELEPDGERQRGPALELALPLFDQGQAGLTRADARLQAAEATADELDVRIAAQVREAAAQTVVTAQMADRYRDTLVPAQAAVVRESQLRVNFMLIGVFELIAARQEEYDAWQDYIEVVRDHWIARARLRHAVGGRLPDDAAGVPAPLDLQPILPDPAAADDGHQHQHHQHSAQAEPASTPATPAHDHHGSHGAQPTATPPDAAAAPAERAHDHHSGHDDAQTPASQPDAAGDFR